MPFLLECKKRSERRGLIVPILEKSLRKRSRRLFCRRCPMSGKTEGLPKLDYSCFWSVYEKNNPFFRVAGAVAAGGGISGHWLCIPAFYRDSLSRMRNNQSLYSVFTGACGRRVLLSSAILTVILLVVMVLKDGRMFRSQKANRWFWIVILLMYLSVYLVRMFLLFPDTPPMELNEQAPLWKLWEWFLTSCM